MCYATRQILTNVSILFRLADMNVQTLEAEDNDEVTSASISYKPESEVIAKLKISNQIKSSKSAILYLISFAFYQQKIVYFTD